MSNIGSSTLGKMTNSGRVTSKVGQLLQEARRQRGLEIKDIAASTHVRSEYLSALEEGRFSELPENVYTRNFLRLYAEAVGLDEKEVLEHYSLERYGKSDAPRKSVYPSPAYDTSTESYVAGQTATEEETPSKRRGIGWITGLLILSLLGLGGFLFSENYVFRNHETGGYKLAVPGTDREFNLPSFNRSGATTTGTDETSTTVNAANNGESTSSESATSSSDPTLATSTAETTADSTDTSVNAEDGADSSQLTVPAEGENASEGELITPTQGSDAVVEGSEDTSVESTNDTAATAASAAAADATEGNDVAGGLVLFSLSTEPSGAAVTVDGFDLGTTPVNSFPLTASPEKQLIVKLEGYETRQETFDGTQKQEIFYTLEEASAGTGDITDVEGDATTLDSVSISSDGTVVAIDDPTFTPAAELKGKAVITIEDGGEAWLEVYKGTTRDGEALVYQVATDSDRFEVDLPVFVRAGRSSLVKVSVNGGLANPLGPPDVVSEQVFEE